jgi:hypothetical protein
MPRRIWCAISVKLKPDEIADRLRLTMGCCGSLPRLPLKPNHFSRAPQFSRAQEACGVDRSNCGFSRLHILLANDSIAGVSLVTVIATPFA